jgi:RsiW-degrading membrane proteinase PrsW (M82 family)
MSVVAINWLAVIVAAVAKFAIGAVWFTALFGKRWRELMGIPEGAPADGMVTAMIVQIIGDLIMAYILARFLAHYGATTLWDGILIGFMAWLGFVATIMAGQIFYEKKKPELIAIGAGYQLVGIVVMGAILAMWH